MLVLWRCMAQRLERRAHYCEVVVSFPVLCSWAKHFISRFSNTPIQMKLRHAGVVALFSQETCGHKNTVKLPGYKIASRNVKGNKMCLISEY